MSDFDSSKFDDGASYLMSDDSFKQFADGAKSLGRPDSESGNLFYAPVHRTVKTVDEVGEAVSEMLKNTTSWM